jgi:hypothetical protein
MQRKKARFVMQNLRAVRIFQTAAKIQKRVRGMSARMRWSERIVVQNGIVIAASRVIMRAWTNYRIGLRWTKLIAAHRIKVGMVIVYCCGSLLWVYLSMLSPIPY